MKKTSLLLFRIPLKYMLSKHSLVIVTLLLLSAKCDVLLAQNNSRLSVQGILKKASGEAVDDDIYILKFKLWTAETGGSNVWSETQDSVEVISGIYSTVLGNVTPLSIPFNQVYYLGVQVGATEMKPRIQLTSAPYALALIGTSNQFPSGGQVIADSIKVNGNVLTENGTPGQNGANKNGYGFVGDRDSGLFGPTLAGGEVSIYVNNAEIIEVKPALVDIKTDVAANNLSLKVTGGLDYNGLDDWRLVEVDNFTTDNEDWKTYAPKNANEGNGWNNLNSPAPVNSPTAGDATKFIGKYLAPSENNLVLKKQFDLSTAGTFTQIKVKFKYYFLDTWNPVTDLNSVGNDIGWGAFATSEDGNQFRLSWWEHAWSTDYIANMNVAGSLFPAANKWGGVAGFTDFMKNGEMTAYRNGTDTGVWVMFGTGLNNGFGDERWGVGMIEIWVK